MLRFLAIVSSIVGIGYNYFLTKGRCGCRSLAWRFHGHQCVAHRRYLMERSAIHFSDDERELYETIFKGFAPVEFMKLMRIAEWRDADQGAVFATEGRPVDGLRLLFSGEVNVERDGRKIGSASDGALVGEMSFIQGGDASATVTTTVPCRYIFWSEKALRGLLRRNPNIDIAMQHVFSLDLTRKLTGDNTGTIRTTDLD